MKLLLAALLAAATVAAQSTPPRQDDLEPVPTSVTVRGEVETATTSFVTAIDETELAAKPGVNIDDRLRDLPGFTLFRRTSSVVTHPTTQGVSLRGIGSNAASRTLVLYDGVPINDPFGGWVYWTRVNPMWVDRVEVSRGASSSIYGDRAMGGSVGLFRATPATRRGWLGATGGSAGIADANGGYQQLQGDWGFSAGLRAFRSDGWFVVPENERGSVDRKADSDFVTSDVSLDWFGSEQRLTLRGNVLAEQRINGTQFRTNSSSMGTAGLSYQWRGIAATAYHSRVAFRNAFSAVGGGRTTERLTLRQFVTSEDTGGSLLWRTETGPLRLIIGADTHRASGLSRDTVIFNGFVRRPGGRLWQAGTFIQGEASFATGFALSAGLRHDFADRGNDFWSPRGGIAFSEGPRRWRLSAFRAFRSPTLNEFFRQFRVGDITTFGNTGLRPETTTGVDTGLDWRGESWTARGTVFWQEIDNLIGNATIQTEPAILRRRDNLGSARGVGMELELSKRFGPIRAQGSYLLIDSDLSTGFQMPQVPRHQGSALLSYTKGKSLLSAGVRSNSSYFEDDVNRFILPGFATVQFLAEREVAAGVRATLAVENALNRRYTARFVPNGELGTPRLARAGLRWNFGK